MLFSSIIKRRFDAVLGRYDVDEAVYTYKVQDFDGLQASQLDIDGPHGCLRGYFYYHNEPNMDKLIIFDHGVGSGHTPYLPSIYQLVSAGFTVYAYDHTGCAASDGEGILGFAQGIADLDCVLTSLQNSGYISSSGVRLIGHSWGAYSSMNIAGFHPEVTHVVSLGGFLSARSLIEQYLPWFVKHYSDEVMDRERIINPQFADMDARDNLSKTKARVLHIQSTDDKKVFFNLCTPLLQDALSDNKNIEYLIVEGKNHDPQLTYDASVLHTQMEHDLDQFHKHNPQATLSDSRAFLDAHDWKAMSVQDPFIWETICEFLS